MVLSKKIKTSMDDIDENDSMYEAEILPRLRLNTLQSFKLVSKTWLNHIKSPYFYYYYLQKSIQNHHLNLIFFDNYTNSVETFDAETLVPSAKSYDLSLTRTLRIVGSCNGLLCFKSTDDIRDECGNILYNFVLFNPATGVEKSFRVLPVMNLENNNSYNKGFGFTCDNKNMDYKLVFIKGLEIHVYSLKTLQWKRIGDYPCKNWLWKTPEEHEARGVPTDNALHWLSGTQLGEISIFSIDLNNGGQQFETPLSDTRTPTLVTLGGRLHLIFRRYTYGVDENPVYTFDIDIWVMRKYGCFDDSCVRLFKVRIDDLKDFATPVSIREGGRKVLLQLLHFRESKKKHSYVWYDLVTKECDCKVHEVSAYEVMKPCLETLVDPRF